MGKRVSSLHKQFEIFRCNGAKRSWLETEYSGCFLRAVVQFGLISKIRVSYIIPHIYLFVHFLCLLDLGLPLVMFYIIFVILFGKKF